MSVLQQMAAGRREVLAEVLQRLEPEELAIVERAFELVHAGVQRCEPGRRRTSVAACVVSHAVNGLAPAGERQSPARRSVVAGPL